MLELKNEYITHRIALDPFLINKCKSVSFSLNQPDLMDLIDLNPRTIVYINMETKLIILEDWRGHRITIIWNWIKDMVYLVVNNSPHTIQDDECHLDIEKEIDLYIPKEE